MIMGINIIARVRINPIKEIRLLRYRVMSVNPARNPITPIITNTMFITILTSSSGRSLDLQFLQKIREGVEADKKVPIVMGDLHTGHSVSNFTYSLSLGIGVP